MRFVKVAAHHLHFGSREGRHIVKVDTAHLQLVVACSIGLVPFTVAGYVVVVGVGRGGVVDDSIIPGVGHAAIIHIGWPCAEVVGVGIGIELATIRHGYVAKNEDSLYIGDIGIVCLDAVFYGSILH